MTTRMLIDARHQEETRVAVLSGNRIEEFDFESADHKQIKGNIYLAKVTRVEPSLQAAFVDYGGNRHGFLAFSEIHPDYYQIPKEDRAALLAEEAAHAAEEAELRDEEDGDEDDYDGDNNGRDGARDDESSDSFADELVNDGGDTVEVATPTEAEVLGEDGDDAENSDAASEDGNGRGQRGGNGRGGRRQGRGQAKASDEARAKRMALRRRYKIQDVIQRRQVLLVQVVKEERGNKGAALTTYLSLAGRYCVLMPNSAHGGGISRKISSGADRKRLKSIIAEMKLPKTMGCIVRTAGLSRTKPEIKRDFDYLARLWDEIRENTLKSAAPATIHSDNDLIKRAIRDIYNREIEEVLVEGENGYRAAKDFMKLLMPSHARRVKNYVNPTPLFQQYGAEDQLSAMYEPVVQLKSGGYLVINPTEALVSIDINSGRSTKEHGIEATALNTNLEAAREIARQLRLRDMAGLVVIDFIDMEYGNNVRKVEKAMRDALRHDRARIQVGRISGFGLMEMSRQRLRTGMLEASTRVCPHCDGTGLVRTASSAGLSALRMLEEEAAQGRGSEITLRTSQEATIYVLNNKRSAIADIEERYGVTIQILPDGQTEGAKMVVSASGPRPTKVVEFKPVIEPEDEEEYGEDEDEDEISDTAEEKVAVQPVRRDAETDEEGDRPARKRRRRRRGRRNRGAGEGSEAVENEAAGDAGRAEGEISGSEGSDDGSAGDGNSDSDATGDGATDSADETATGDTERGDRPAAKSRRGRRGRGAGKAAEPAGDALAEDTPGDIVVATNADGQADEAGAGEQKPDAGKPRRPRKQPKARGADEAVTEVAVEPEAEKPAPKPRRSRKKVEPAVAEEAVAQETVTVEAEAEPVVEKPKRRSRAKAAAPAEETVVEATEALEAVAAEPAHSVETPAAPVEEPAGEPANKRGGWWQRTFGA